MNDLIKIDLTKLNKEKVTDLIIAQDGTLAQEAEKELIKILDTQTLINEIVEYVKDRLGKEMEKQKLIKVKSGSLNISKRFSGSRYILKNALETFKLEIKYYKPNTEKIDEYIKVTGNLPKGIERKVREQTISILKREEEL